MTAALTAAVVEHDFSATAECRPENNVSARVVGTADFSVRRVLEDFLVQLHQTASSHRALEVVMDLRELRFMNSSCLKGLVTWICTVRDLPQAQQYHIILVSRPELHWQRRSLHALSSLASELVTIRS